MASPTVPTVPFPTDIDTDDDDDDDLPSLLPSPTASTPPAQPPAPVETLLPTPGPAPAPPPAASSVPGAPSPSPDPNAAATNTNGVVPSGSATPLADSRPSGLSNPTSPNDGGGLSTGAKAGLGVGVAIGVLLMVLAAWLFVRTRRRRRQQKTKISRAATRDVETARVAPGPDVRAYRAPAVPELSNGAGVEKYRYYNELASPVVAQEVHGDREFAVELQGSDVPSSSVAKEGRAWSPSPPTYDQSSAGPHMEKKDGVRLFDDAPIDADDEGTLNVHDQPRATDKKKVS